MDSQDIVPASESSEVARRSFLPEATDPYAPGDLPPELLEFHSPSAALVNMPATPAAQYISWLIGGLILASVLVMTVFPLDRVVTTPGRLVSTDATMVVQPLETSLIRSIDVKEGEYVRKGQILAHLDPTVSEADVGSLYQQTNSYQAETDRLIAETQGTVYKPESTNPESAQQEATFLRRRAEYDARVHDYDAQIASQSSEMQSALANAAMFASRAKVAGDVFRMRSDLQKQQVGSRLSTLGAQSELMEVERSQISAQHMAASARSKIMALTAERDGYIQKWKADVYQQLAEAQRHLSETRSSYDKARLRKSMVTLRAEEDGVVLTIAKLSAGSVINTATPLLTLIPIGSGLEMEASLRGSDIGFVQLGDHALLKFATFPYSQYGGAEATVKEISADSFAEKSAQDGVGAADIPDPSGDSKAFYRVHLRIDKYTLHGVPSFFHPQPGMPVTADIKVGKRTIMQFILNSMIPLATEGMREP
ncbi:HlyD family type I secretion periplasmic adaptor subunit [Acetobacter sp. AN02]|uniref:HlyD family type I secretion periplasmic adaptor subunit n=1 Tax=Acetobacter sp. AN02 TaxID=2894186 RepID=UPI0024340CD1|nr:HlyD family type I secretion periplasmic adaptor subunit [Acetobacter sp. AN02]MDG6094030.1 HlyD family type I secretion periplasmic adaptor subunit [Acetobacter sp. AN02]